jgi:transcriptional regulator with XRE-family HTH domain
MVRGNLSSTIGWMFQNERAQRQMSQARAAQRLGATQQWVSQIERGAVSPTTDVIERLFGIFDLRVILDVEPIGSDLDGEIDDVSALSDGDRVEVVDCFRRAFEQLAGVPWVLSGRLGAFVQGAPVRVLRLDVAVAEPDLDRLGRVFEQHGSDRWNERLMEYYGMPAHPRMPGPMRWLVGGCELRLEVTERLPPAITVAVAGRCLPVRPLADIEARYRSIARLMRRARTRVIHRQQ